MSVERATGSGPGRRRVRYGLRAGAVLLAVTASCMFVGLMASRATARFDVTATREHRLSPRTESLLARIERPHEVVIAGNLSALDTATARRSRDVLEALSHASPNVRVTMIDTASGQGLAQYDELLRRQVEASAGMIGSAVSQLTAGADTAAALADGLETLSEAMLRVRQSAQPAPGVSQTEAGAQVTGFLEARAAMARLAAQDLRGAAENARAGLGRSVGRAPLPPLDEVARLLRPSLAKAADEAAAVEQGLAAIAGTEQVGPGTRSEARTVRPMAVDARDRAARAMAVLDGMQFPPILAAARTLERSGGALVIASASSADELRPHALGQRTPGITAIRFESLFPPRAAAANPGEPVTDQRFRAEELLATALGALNNPAAPIVVFVHGAPATLAPDYTIMGGLVDRLRLRGIDVAEWAAGVESEPPSLTRLDPAGTRPVVYVSISTYATTPDGAARMSRLANALRKIVENGEPLLLSAVQSTLPTFGEPDPMVSFLGDLGVRVDTARPILKQYRTPTGRYVAAELHLPDPGPGTEHPIAQTLRGLPVMMFWPLRISSMEPGAGTGESRASFSPLLIAPHDADTWAEADWLGYWQIPAEQRASVRNPPAPDSARDDREGPWILSAAVERRLPGRAAPQRTVIVGSNGWFFDQVTQQVAGVVDGRTVFASPGNAELFEAAVYWLAGQDELIAPSPAAQAVPLIPAMSAERLAAIRWVLVLGLPGLTLLCGVAYRLLRG